MNLPSAAILVKLYSSKRGTSPRGHNMITYMDKLLIKYSQIHANLLPFHTS